MEAVLEPCKTLISTSGFYDWLWRQGRHYYISFKENVFLSKVVFSCHLLLSATSSRLPASEDIQASRWPDLECEHEKGQVTATNCFSFDI